MRLTCPNCGAQYEVPDEVIPETGRDVQCSNCGDTWFQPHPATLGYEAPEEDWDEESWDEDDSAPEPEAAPAPAPRRAPPVPPLSDAYDENYEDYDEDYDDEEPAPPPPPAGRQRRLAPEVKSILQEEAAAEERARVADPLESQPDLGLDAPQQSPRDRAMAAAASTGAVAGAAAQDKPSLRLTPEEKAAMAADQPASRRNLLPDIEEINSTLRRQGDGVGRGEPRRTTPLVREKRRGFRRGFMLSLIVVLVGAIIYLQAPKIASAIPPLAGPMQAYVGAVNRGRVWLDAQAQSLVVMLDEMSSSDAPDPAPATEGTASETPTSQ